VPTGANGPDVAARLRPVSPRWSSSHRVLATPNRREAAGPGSAHDDRPQTRLHVRTPISSPTPRPASGVARLNALWDRLMDPYGFDPDALKNIEQLDERDQ
jgi:hypothetical protein